jgi:CBS-domain-containing membrane protein
MGTADPALAAPVLELTDDDVHEAMAELSGYLDITTEDFRELCRHAFHHAVDRLVGSVTARQLMEPVQVALYPEMGLEEAARTLAAASASGAPVVDGAGRVLGMLTDKDFLRQVQATSFMEVLVHYLAGEHPLADGLRECCVERVMSAPAVVFREDTRFFDMAEVFRRHPFSRVPVVSGAGTLLGVVLRERFLHACPGAAAA